MVQKWYFLAEQNYWTAKSIPTPDSRAKRKVLITNSGSMGSRAFSSRCHTPTRCFTYKGNVNTKSQAVQEVALRAV